MILYNKIKTIYPNLNDTDFLLNTGTILLQNDGDGNGDYIAQWNHPTLAKPTEEQLGAIE
jgi:hypothetical protein